jgi:hypothetical protein
VLSRRMQVPCGSRAGLKGDIGTGVMGSLVVWKQHLYPHVSGEIGLRPLERLLRTGGIQRLVGRRIRRESGLAEYSAVEGEQPRQTACFAWHLETP